MPWLSPLQTPHSWQDYRKRHKASQDKVQRTTSAFLRRSQSSGTKNRNDIKDSFSSNSQSMFPYCTMKGAICFPLTSLWNHAHFAMTDCFCSCIRWKTMKCAFLCFGDMRTGWITLEGWVCVSLFSIISSIFIGCRTRWSHPIIFSIGVSPLSQLDSFCPCIS